MLEKKINKIINNLELKNIILKEIEFDEMETFKSSIYLLGVGKCGYYQLRDFLDVCSVKDIKIKDVLAITKKDHYISDKEIEIVEGTHPILSEKSILAGQTLFNFLDRIGPEDKLIVLLSGGASSLVEALNNDITLEIAQNINDILLKSKANIEEINLIRSAISKIKSGGLLHLVKTKYITVYVSSDVSSNKLEFIGSGPFFHKTTDYLDLKSAAERYLPLEEAGIVCSSFLKKNEVLEKSQKVNHHIIQDYKTLLNVAKREFDMEGFIFDKPLDGDIEYCLSSMIEKISKNLNKTTKNHIILSVGECSFDVLGDGIGGRNLEFVLRLAKKIFYNNILNLKLTYLKRISFFSVGTDGTDGPTDVAGAHMDYNLFIKANKMKLDIDSYLLNNDSYNFFKKLGSTIFIEKGRTNLMDLRSILIKSI